MESKKSKEHVEKKEEVVEINFGKHLDKLRANPWIASTFVLALILILVLAFGGSGSTGTVVSAEDAGAKVLGFINSNPQITGEVTLASVVEEGQFYQVILNYEGQQVPVYTTLDGEFLVSNPVSLGEIEPADSGDSQPTTPPTQVDESIPKSDKPVVELFVMSHCPYGTQSEKGAVPVAELLGDKIDFEIKFVYYAMHGETEVYEQANQYCIQEEQNDKFLDYLTCFLEAGDGEGCLTEVGIDKAKMETCVARIDTEFSLTANLEDQSTWLSGRFPLFDIHKVENEEYGVRGSPTLVVNGKQASSGRDSASILATVCGAFNTVPEECATELSAASPSPGFGWDATAGSETAATCG
ncbi:MAG: hypothetical protein ABIH92_04670 [Nanoarchaeota archaeon]